jgi:crossover junction endodeoxyribonuclease RuvC
LPGERLKIINSDLDSLILKHKPDFIAVESLYFFKNLKTAMPVSQAKGVILLTAAKRKIPVLEFTPLEVKMTVAGYGRAEKKQVQKMIQNFLKLKEFPKQDDAADALGVALCGILKKNSKLS